MVAIRISDVAAERIDALKPELAASIGLPTITREQAVGFLLEEALRQWEPKNVDVKSGTVEG